MRTLLFALVALLLTTSCNDAIKNPNPKVDVEPGTEVVQNNTESVASSRTTPNESHIGNYVGWFNMANLSDNHDKVITADEAFYWARENKINIAIDSVSTDAVYGHSVVAGNQRPFTGHVQDNVYRVREPGDHKYDGAFEWVIQDNDTMIGTWEAYNNIEIKNRKYKLARTDFEYNADQMLDQYSEYVDWNKYTSTTETNEIDGEPYDWEYREFATATDAIHELNGSNKVLTKADVENLKRGDLIIIRNMIYARHGYSFKKRPLRVFFDEQDWYVPVYNDIRDNLTDIEKQNIQLLLSYEENAAEYYDYFGRG